MVKSSGYPGAAQGGRVICLVSAPSSSTVRIEGAELAPERAAANPITKQEVNHMKRWTLLIAGIMFFCGIGLSVTAALADDDGTNAVVSFGQWETDPPLDRIATPVPAMGANNRHQVIPNEVKIKEEIGSVSFIIAGLHNVQVYEDGTKPQDINTSSPLPGAAGGIIDDPNGRMYRGLDPNLPVNPRDRVEVVLFDKPGTYLVICGVVNHFVNDRMFGFVTVKD